MIHLPTNACSQPLVLSISSTALNDYVGTVILETDGGRAGLEPPSYITHAGDVHDMKRVGVLQAYCGLVAQLALGGSIAED